MVNLGHWFDYRKDNYNFMPMFCGVHWPLKKFLSWVGFVLFCCGVLLMIILLPLSIQKVDENEMAIPYGKYSCKAGDPLDAGRHTLSPDDRLYVYDRKFITNTNEGLRCVSKDGLIITLNVAFQYQIKKDDLKSIFFEIGTQKNLDQYIDIITQDAVRDVCSKFKGEEYFSHRGDVEVEMQRAITHAINSARCFVEPGGVQLKNIALPQSFIEAIESKQLALEDVDVALNEREQTLIEARTKQKEAELEAEIVKVKADANASAILISANEQADARLSQWAERTENIKIDLTNLGLTPEEYVNDYLFPRLISRTTTTDVQACLNRCEGGQECWWCWVRGVNNMPSPLTV